MEKIKINQQFGTKWFTFYAHIRPWLACLTSLDIFIGFAQDTDVYFSYWWMLLYFIAGITQLVLSLIVFIKSNGDYKDFVHFVKGVLIFEIINMAYQACVRQYIETSDVEFAIIIGVVILVLGYFLWYRLNIRYFEKRIPEKTPNVINDMCNSISKQHGVFNLNNAPQTYSYCNMPNNEIKSQPEEKIKNARFSNTPYKVQYCRICGEKLLADSIFCSNCGTKVILETEDKVVDEVVKATFESKEKDLEKCDEFECLTCKKTFIVSADEIITTCPYCNTKYKVY